MAAFCWLFFFIVQMIVCIWLVDGVLYKVALIALFNTVYCTLSICKGYFTVHSITRFTSPVIVASVLFISFDRYAKDNLILRRAMKQQKIMYEKHLEKIRDPVIIFNQSQIFFSNNAI